LSFDYKIIFAREGSPAMSSPVLLCIDDRPQMLQVRKTNLEPLGYSVLTATNASTAIAILEQLAVAAVLVEYKHEGIDAEAVAYQIKQRFPDEPIILLSAYSDMPERPLWLMDEYVMKSEPLERLAEVVERVTRPTPKIAPRRETTA
jgi:CheY-like chemotaxis protein